MLLDQVNAWQYQNLLHCVIKLLHDCKRTSLWNGESCFLNFCIFLRSPPSHRNHACCFAKIFLLAKESPKSFCLFTKVSKLLQKNVFMTTLFQRKKVHENKFWKRCFCVSTKCTTAEKRQKNSSKLKSNEYSIPYLIFFKFFHQIHAEKWISLNRHILT